MTACPDQARVYICTVSDDGRGEQLCDSNIMFAFCSYLDIVFQGFYISKVLESFHGLTVRSDAREDEP